MQGRYESYSDGNLNERERAVGCAYFNISTNNWCCFVNGLETSFQRGMAWTDSHRRSSRCKRLRGSSSTGGKET